MSLFPSHDRVGRIHWYDEQKDQGYAGCCDIIYKDNNGQVILGDFKTSLGPYSYKFPSTKIEIEDKLRKALISGVFKLKKTQLQLAAYKLAAERCLDIKIDKTQIIVSTAIPDFSVQVFTFGENEIQKHEDQWLELLNKFYTQL